MITVAVLALALLQTPSAAPQGTPELLPELPDSAAVAKLRSRLRGQQEARVRVGREWVEVTRPQLVGDTALGYRAAFFDRFVARDSLPNPFSLTGVSQVQVKGRSVLPSVLGGSLSLGVSALASMVLTRAVDSNSGIDGDEIVRVTLIALGAGAAVGALDGVLRTRWVTIYQR